MEDAQCVEGAE